MPDEGRINGGLERGVQWMGAEVAWRVPDVLGRVGRGANAEIARTYDGVERGRAEFENSSGDKCGEGEHRRTLDDVVFSFCSR